MKKLLFCALAGAIGFAGAKTYEHSQKDYSDDLLLQNVEALTDGDEVVKQYINHHAPYYDPVTQLKTKKCYAFCYETPYHGSLICHKHGATKCCRVPN